MFLFVLCFLLVTRCCNEGTLVWLYEKYVATVVVLLFGPSWDPRIIKYGRNSNRVQRMYYCESITT